MQHVFLARGHRLKAMHKELGGTFRGRHPEMLVLWEVHLPAAELFSSPCPLEQHSLFGEGGA